MILRMTAAAIAIAVGFGGNATAQLWRIPGVGDPSRALLVDHKDKHKDAKNKNRGREDDEDEDQSEDRGRGRRSSTTGQQRSYAPSPYDYAPSPYYDPNTRAPQGSPRRWTNPEPSR